MDVWVSQKWSEDWFLLLAWAPGSIIEFSIAQAGGGPVVGQA